MNYIFHFHYPVQFLNTFFETMHPSPTSLHMGLVLVFTNKLRTKQNKAF